MITINLAIIIKDSALKQSSHQANNEEEQYKEHVH